MDNKHQGETQHHNPFLFAYTQYCFTYKTHLLSNEEQSSSTPIPYEIRMQTDSRVPEKLLQSDLLPHGTNCILPNRGQLAYIAMSTDKAKAQPITYQESLLLVAIP